jgi:tetratricopeptide (TPR) repeat protein
MKRCLLLLACTFVLACGKAKPPIILISIDTLRADHLSAYGYRGAATPHLDGLARDSVVYRNAWSHCPLTLPSHLSMLTGLLPPEHGVRDNAGYHFDGGAHPTVARLLREKGYRTGGAISAYVLRSATGVSDGFDDYDDAIGVIDGAPLGALQRPGAATEAIAERWIDAHAKEPFFYFLHLYEPHAPYAPTYDADVAASDRITGALLEHLRKTGLYDRALIILVSDHGEGLMEHGEQEHGVFLYREDLHVPLMVKLPAGTKRGNVDGLAELIDVAPTILEAAGVTRPASMKGVSLLGRDGQSQVDGGPARTSYAESLFARIHFGWSELRSGLRGPLHVIDAPRGEVYDLGADRGERHNVIDRERRAFAELRDFARRTGGDFQAPERIDPEEAKKLAALGYVSAGPQGEGGALADPKDVIGQLTQLKAVDDLRKRGDREGTIAALTALLAANPRWSDVREELGQEYDAAGDHASAARVYQEGIRLTPRLAGAFALSAGFALLESGQTDDAAAHAAISLSSGEAGAHLLLGEIALVRHDPGAAAREASAAEGSAPQKAHALFLRARVAAAQHDYPQVLELLDDVRRAAKAQGGSLPRRFHVVAADALARMNRFPEAEAEFERAITADPRDAKTYADLSLLQLIGGRRDAAHATLARLAATHPKPAVCLDIAKQLETFGEKGEAAVWRQRGAGPSVNH